MSMRNYLTAPEVAEIMGVSVPTAYKIIRKLNDELKAKGYITVCGKVSRAYFEHKTYSVSA
jgi:sugar-specific transcriptional regulator TrmB